MPSYTYTLEDYAPMITYSSDWAQGTSASDGLAYRYSHSSFQATNHAGGTAKFSFNGTGVAIYGAKRDNHGLYQVTVDGTAGSPLNGLDTGNSFQVILFEVHNLSLGKHDIVVTNLDQNKYLDIDFVTIDGVVGGNGGSGQVYTTTVQDSDPSFTYLPSLNAWSASPNNLGTYSGSSGHVTSNQGASVSYTFTTLTRFLPKGEGVGLYGPLSTDGAPYSVQLDGLPVLNATTVRDRYWPQALLYQGMNLGGGKHHLQVFYQSTASGQTFAVDYADVLSTKNPNSSNGGDSGGLSAGAAVGITAGAFVIVILIAAIAYILSNWRRPSSNKKETLKSPLAGPTPFTMQQDGGGSQTPLTRSHFGSIISHPNDTPPARYNTSASSPEMSSGYLPTIASVGHSANISHPGQMYSTPLAVGSATRLEWRPEGMYEEDGQGSQRITALEAPLTPQRLGGTPGGARPRLGPNGYPLEKRSRNELVVVSGGMTDDGASSSAGDQFSPPGYMQSV